MYFGVTFVYHSLNFIDIEWIKKTTTVSINDQNRNLKGLFLKKKKTQLFIFLYMHTFYKYKYISCKFFLYLSSNWTWFSECSLYFKYHNIHVS